MRHRDSGRKFGRKSGPRRALERDLVRSLFTHGRIETTLARAKEYRSSAEKLITLARRGIAAKERGDAAGWLHAFRRARAELGGTRSAETVTRRLFDEIAPQFRDRAGGYTRVIRHWRSVLDGLDGFQDPCSRVRHERALDPIPDDSQRSEQGFGVVGGVELEIDHDVVRIVDRPQDPIPADTRPLAAGGIGVERSLPRSRAGV